MSNPTNIVFTVLSRKVAEKISNSGVALDDTVFDAALKEVLAANPSFLKFDWKDPKNKKTLVAGVNSELTNLATSDVAEVGRIESQPSGTFVLPKKMNIKGGKPNITFNPDGSFNLLGGKELVMGCPEGSEPTLTQIGKKGRKKQFVGGCQVN